MTTFEFDASQVIAIQNRASDLWDTSTKPEDHDEYVAVANRLLGALEMFWGSAKVVEHEEFNMEEKKIE